MGAQPALDSVNEMEMFFFLNFFSPNKRFAYLIIEPLLHANVRLVSSVLKSIIALLSFISM